MRKCCAFVTDEKIASLESQVQALTAKVAAMKDWAVIVHAHQYCANKGLGICQGCINSAKALDSLVTSDDGTKLLAYVEWLEGFTGSPNPRDMFEAERARKEAGR